MAKGDQKRATELADTSRDAWKQSIPQSQNDYKSVMQNYQNFLAQQQQPQQQQQQQQPQGDKTGGTNQDPQQMFMASMQKHGLDPVAVQGHGDQIAAALKADYPNLDIKVDPKSDAIMWPGIGPIDVTIDSGKGGWSFRPSGYVDAQGNAQAYPEGQGQGNNTWGQMANTGGFSPQDIQNMRARAVAPIRSAYQQGQSELERNRALQGGYSPNYAAASAKMARDQAYGMADATTNADAGIAQMRQQGQLAGLQGLTGAQLGGMQGMSSLYGTTPGLTNMFGEQAINAMNTKNNTKNWYDRVLQTGDMLAKFARPTGK